LVVEKDHLIGIMKKGHLAFSKTNKAIRFDFFKDYFFKRRLFLFICLDFIFE